MADEQPVLFSDRTGTNGVLGQVVVNFQAPIFQITIQRFPFSQGILHRLAQRALGQTSRQQGFQLRFKRGQDGRGLLRPQSFSLFGRQPLVPRVALNQIEFAQLGHDHAGLLGPFLQRGHKLAPCRRPAAHAEQARVVFGQRTVNPITVPLQIALKITQQRLRVLLAPAGMELEDHLATRHAGHPQPAGGAAVRHVRVQHPHRGFVHLQIIPGQQFPFHFPHQRLQPSRAFFHPVAQRLAGKVDAQAREPLLLPVERLMIHEFAQEHVRHQTGPGLALLDHLRRQGGDAHAAVPARAGQLGPEDFMPADLGRDVFKALALFAANLALGLTAVGADFFPRLNPLADRLQNLDGGLAAGPGFAALGFRGQQHFLGGGGFGRRGKERK